MEATEVIEILRIIIIGLFISIFVVIGAAGVNACRGYVKNSREYVPQVEFLLKFALVLFFFFVSVSVAAGVINLMHLICK